MKRRKVKNISDKMVFGYLGDKVMPGDIYLFDPAEADKLEIQGIVERVKSVRKKSVRKKEL
jgi:hypothetical protein